MHVDQKEFVLPFMKKIQVAKDTYSFYFDRSKIQFEFLPGQYVRISFPGIESQSFTIASNPLEKDYIKITTKMRSTSEFKKSLLGLHKNDNVFFYGPVGGFVLRDEDSFEHIFLAGGIGVTPFYSMITYAAQKKLSIPITLFVSFSSSEEIIYFEEFTSIAKQRSNIKIVYTISNPDKTWKGEMGRISEELIRKHLHDVNKPTYYIVGQPTMVEETEEMLEKIGIALNKIKVENFTGY